MRSRLVVVVVALLVAGGAAAAAGAPPKGAVISPASPTVRWTGELTSGQADTLPVRLEVPASHWSERPGGVTVRVEWTAPDTELDLRVTDARDRELAQSVYGGRTFQQVYLFRPARGTYSVTIDAVVAAAAGYTATASLVRDPVRQAELVRGGMRFSQGLVDPQVLSAEPGIVTGAGGKTFVVAPWGLTTLSSMVWASQDGGRSHRLRPSIAAAGVAGGSRRPCPHAVGGADSDVTVDRTGRLYFAALSSASVAVGYSVDDGQTWTCTPVGSTIPENDRPWLAAAPTADGPGAGTDAYLVYHDLALGQLPVGQEVKPVQIHVDATRDGGRTWEPRSAFGRGLVPFAGPVFTHSDGTVYQSFQAGNAAWLARSTDEGATFTLHRVAQRHGDAGNTWVTGAVDARGTVYVAWVDGGSYQTLYSYSRDRGGSWSAPVRVSPPDSVAMLPWISAGTAGDVAISWYGARSREVPDLVPSATPWFPYVARSARADVPRPSFELVSVSDVPVHRGPVCTPCSGDHGKLGDMLETSIGPDGQLLAAYSDNARADAELDPPYPYLVVARQVAGQGLSRAEAARAAAVTERAGDAGEAPELDLAALPTAAAVGSELQVSIPLAALPGAGDGTSGTDRYSLVLWKANDRVNYVGMHVSPTGAVAFLGGDEPVGVEAAAAVGVPAARRQLYASYPPAFPVTGRLDTRRGVVTLSAPLTRYRLAPGQTLHMLQAFTLEGVTGRRTSETMLQAVDSTPARSVRLR